MTTKTKWTAVALVVLIATVVTLAMPSGSPEPSFQGRTLGRWLEDLDDWDGSSNSPAVTAVQAIGTNGIPCLLSYIAVKDNPLSHLLYRIPYFSWAASLVHLHLDQNDATMKHQRAIAAFFALGEKGKSAIPALTRLLRKPETASSAAFVLAHMGLQTMPILAEAATNSDRSIRSSAVGAFSAWGAQAKAAIPVLTNALNDQDYYVRSCAAFTLGRLGPGDRSVVIPHLIRAMADPHPNVRAKAAEALGTLCEPSDNVMLVLRKALDDPVAGVRRMATNSLHQLTTSQGQ